MLSHRTLYLHMLSVAATFYNDETTVELHTIPLFHANGWGRPQCATLHGLKQVMVRRFDPAQVLRLIQEERATCMSLVPTMANALLNCPELGKFDLSSLRAGHAGRRGVVARAGWRGWKKRSAAAAMAGYGLTETGPVASCARDKIHRLFERRRRPPAAPRHGGLAAARLRNARGGPADERRAARHADHRRDRDPRRPRHGRLLQGAARPPPT